MIHVFTIYSNAYQLFILFLVLFFFFLSLSPTCFWLQAIQSTGTNVWLRSSVLTSNAPTESSTLSIIRFWRSPTSVWHLAAIICTQQQPPHSVRLWLAFLWLLLRNCSYKHTKYVSVRVYLYLEFYYFVFFIWCSCLTKWNVP